MFDHIIAEILKDLEHFTLLMEVAIDGAYCEEKYFIAFLALIT